MLPPTSSKAVQLHFPPSLSPHKRPNLQMEGLIPLLYKAIKDRRSGPVNDAGVVVGAGVDLSDPEQRRLWLEQAVRSPLHAATEAQQRRQRSQSLEELAGEVGSSTDRRLRVALPKARSVRVFSCIGAGFGAGAA
ncbi:hypothetical protein GUJ93_ZPchr0010g9766 [Zizania palustris]|uniref:Uncharacterized protein n=1 Tax=Zizania palustris TaxID=103762 RepID=A0A8J5WC16_ZIZPA|nr:hypothetical protein GUJ93_ZPchr0010g9766 [Zizania palustris]